MIFTNPETLLTQKRKRRNQPLGMTLYKTEFKNVKTLSNKVKVVLKLAHHKASESKDLCLPLLQLKVTRHYQLIHLHTKPPA